MEIKVIGAGISGLLAARYLGARHKVTIHEKQGSLPNNHSSVMRFRSERIAVATNIRFERVRMIKCVHPHSNPVADSISYSIKNSGYARSDRSIVSGLVEQERFIAPPDFVQLLAAQSKIIYESPLTKAFVAMQMGEPIISTIPMIQLMEILNYDRLIPFYYRHGRNIVAMVNDCEAYASVLIPDPKRNSSRISITKDQLIVEGNEKLDMNELHYAATLLGIPLRMIDLDYAKVVNQMYMKIIPIDDRERRDFMYWASSKFNIYSLGRYACWRPSLLLDDQLNDLRLIEGWITNSSKYDVKLASKSST